MERRRLFTEQDTWSGRSYELAIELGLHSDARLEAALIALWQSERLDGCCLGQDIEPAAQQRFSPSLETLERCGSLLDVLTLPDGVSVACGMIAIREEAGSNWLTFFVPIGALSFVYDVGAFPCDDGKDSRVWREPLDDCLVKLARAMFAVVAFPLALVGHEVSGSVSAADITATGIPTERWDGYLWQESGNLIWYPPTIYSAEFTFAPKATD